MLTEAIDAHLVPLGYEVEASGPAPNTAGGFFTYLRIPHFFERHKVYAKTVAALALRDHSLRVAFGHMFVVTGDESSVTRAEQDCGFAYCLRLCWAWLEVDKIREAIERLAQCTSDVQARVERGEDVTKGLVIGIR